MAIKTQGWFWHRSFSFRYQHQRTTPSDEHNTTVNSPNGLREVCHSNLHVLHTVDQPLVLCSPILWKKIFVKQTEEIMLFFFQALSRLLLLQDTHLLWSFGWSMQYFSHLLHSLWENFCFFFHHICFTTLSLYCIHKFWCHHIWPMISLPTLC